jgi:ribose 5-phosphate isomerase B
MAMETAQNKRIVLGCDHAGFALKSVVAQYLLQQGYDVQDVGCFSESDRVDYPSVAEEVARLMQSSGIEKGIITCGSGVGVAIAANRFPWVRAVHAHDAYLAQRAVHGWALCFRRLWHGDYSGVVECAF